MFHFEFILHNIFFKLFTTYKTYLLDAEVQIPNCCTIFEIITKILYSILLASKRDIFLQSEQHMGPYLSRIQHQIVRHPADWQRYWHRNTFYEGLLTHISL